MVSIWFKTLKNSLGRFHITLFFSRRTIRPPNVNFRAEIQSCEAYHRKAALAWLVHGWSNHQFLGQSYYYFKEVCYFAQLILHSQIQNCKCSKICLIYLTVEKFYSAWRTSNQNATEEKDYNLVEIIIALCCKLEFRKYFERYQVEKLLSRLKDFKLNLSKTFRQTVSWMANERNTI